MNAPVPLWRQLQAAAGIVAAVRAGESTATALLRVPGELRAGAQALAFHGLRQLGRAEAIRRQLARRAPPPAPDALLCLAIALAWDAAHQAYEPFTLVDQAVEAAKRDAATRAQASFINACLRRLLREREALVAQSDKDPVARWNHPRWWIERLKRDHPQHWQAILEANNSLAPMTLRVNRRKATREATHARLAEAGLQSRPVGDDGLVLVAPRPVHDIPGFDAGALSVQDAGAQLAATLVWQELGQRAPGARSRILDACAAPGGKTAHLLERGDVDVLALDVDPARCERIHQNLARLGLEADVRAADAAQPDAWWDGRFFDAILLDAPCTASGIVRRHPDVRWLRRDADIGQLAAQQERLLTALWPLLQPGGTLVYCTCSVFREEGQTRIDAFVAHNKDARAQPAPGHLLPVDAGKPGRVRDNLAGDHDGFFYAVLQKQA